MTLEKHLKRQRPMQGQHLILIDNSENILWQGSAYFSGAWFNSTIKEYLNYYINDDYLNGGPHGWTIKISKEKGTI